MNIKKSDLVPSKSQWKKWSMPSKVGYISFILTCISLIITIILLVFPEKTNSQPNKYNIQPQEGNVTIIEGNQIVNNRIEKQNTQKDSNLNEEDKKVNYSIQGIYSKKLIRSIEELLDITINPNSKNKINISYSGDIRLLDKNSNMYVYNGGHVVLSIENKCKEGFASLSIPAIRPNKKNELLKLIEGCINNHVEKDVNFFANKILKCITK